MDKKPLFTIKRHQWLWLAVLCLFLGGIYAVEVWVENKAKAVIQEHIGGGECTFNYTLLTNRLTIRFQDEIHLKNIDGRDVSLKEGKIELCGFGRWKYYKEQQVCLDIVEVSAVQLHYKQDSIVRDTNNRKKLFERLGGIRLAFDEVTTDIEEKLLNCEKFRLELEQLSMQDSVPRFELIRFNADSLRYLDPALLELNLAHVGSMGFGRPIEIRDLRIEELNENQRNRVLIKASVDSMSLVGLSGTNDTSAIAIDRCHIENLIMDIDQVAERPFCDGRRPCVKKLITQFIMDLPVRDSIVANGELSFRHFSERKLESSLELTHFDAKFEFDRPDSLQSHKRSKAKIDVQANVNGGIQANVTGTFDGDDDYLYKICTDPFNMTALNSMIPKQEGYTVMIQNGMCKQLCIRVEGKGRRSTADYLFNYKDLDIALGDVEKLKDKALKAAIPLMINKDLNSNNEIEHDFVLPQHRAFFYEIAEHVNYGFKKAILKSWLNRKEN